MKTESLTKIYGPPRKLFSSKSSVTPAPAVNNLSLDFYEGKSVGLIGESGSGKTTLGRMLLYLTPSTSGRVISFASGTGETSDEPTRKFRQDFQMIFQNPLSALNPRLRVVNAITEPLRVHKIGDTSSQLARALQAERGGKSVKVHAFEAATLSLVKEALKGKPRALVSRQHP